MLPALLLPPSNTIFSQYHRISLPTMTVYTTLVFLILFLASCSFAQHLNTYIVQLHPDHQSGFVSKPEWHHSFLSKTVKNYDPESSTRLLYSYHTTTEGFAAQLNETESALLKQLPDVISVRPDTRLDLHTTYSPSFLGLTPNPNGPWAKMGYGTGSIIGVLDTGVWPESPSFDDRSMPPVPKRWRGVCQRGESFSSRNCNRKLIGARFYSKGHSAAIYPPPPPPANEYMSGRDSHGHGTHTSSTAAGAAVANASVLGVGSGQASGLAPMAHVAMYKVCWFSGCYSSDILAGMDDAVRDGVDILSLSLGGFPIPLYEDSIAIGSFRAVQKGVSVICAAGNNGPVQSMVANEAPWIMTVGASTLDRRFPAVLRVGNGKLLYGESMYEGNHFSRKGGKGLDMVYANDGNGGEFCLNGSLPKSKVRGKMVICDRGMNGRAEKSEVVREAGGAAMILANGEINGDDDSVDSYMLPATVISYKCNMILKKYLNSTNRPIGRIIFGGTTIKRARAPSVARFSSRGPSLTSPTILKPDIIAPGVNIIAAWPGNLGPTGLPEDSRRSGFSVLSGTSMSCPHVSGIAALIRTAHPTWSPAAIRSAVMTTADVMDRYGKRISDGPGPADLFAVGSGHVNPVRAMDPGLVYDIHPEDYVTHLCTTGYSKAEIFTITHANVSCDELLRGKRGFSLNYPSMSVAFGKERTVVVMRRVVTNVGYPRSNYRVRVKEPEGVRVRVVPEVLSFREVNEKKSYTVWFETSMDIVKGQRFGEGEMVWVGRIGKKYRVRSPISVTWGS